MLQLACSSPCRSGIVEPGLCPAGHAKSCLFHYARRRVDTCRTLPHIGHRKTERCFVCEPSAAFHWSQRAAPEPGATRNAGRLAIGTRHPGEEATNVLTL